MPVEVVRSIPRHPPWVADFPLVLVATAVLFAVLDLSALGASRTLGLALMALLALSMVLYAAFRWPPTIAYFAIGWLVFEKVVEGHAGQHAGQIAQASNGFLLVTLAWTFLVNLIRRHVPLFTFQQVGAPLAAFVALGVASAIANDVPPTVALLGVLSPIHSMIIFLVVVNIGIHAQHISRFIVATLVITTIISLIGVLQEAPHSPLWGLSLGTREQTAAHLARVNGVFESAIGFGDLLATVLPLALMMLFFHTARGRLRTLLIVGTLIMTAALILTFTREAWAALLFATLLLGAVVERRLLRVFFFSIMPILVPIGIIASPIATRLRETAQGNLRFTLLQHTVPVIRDHLALGAGPGRFGGNVALTTHTPLYAEYHIPQFTYATGGQIDMFWTHTLAESGLLGTAAYLAAIVACFLVGRRAYRFAISPQRKAAVLGLLYAAPVTVFCALFSSVLEASGPAALFWSFMGMLTVLALNPESSPHLRSVDHDL